MILKDFKKIKIVSVFYAFKSYFTLKTGIVCVEKFEYRICENKEILAINYYIQSDDNENGIFTSNNQFCLSVGSEKLCPPNNSIGSVCFK